MSRIEKDEAREERISMEVIQMASADECSHEMLVEIKWQGRKFGVPLAQLQPLNVNEQTQEAIEDWHYWMDRGYEL